MDIVFGLAIAVLMNGMNYHHFANNNSEETLNKSTLIQSAKTYSYKHTDKQWHTRTQYFLRIYIHKIQA